MAVSKQELLYLIDQLHEKDIPLVANLLKRLIHPDDRNIAYDDEPLTNDDIRAIHEARKEYLEGKTIKFEDIKHELQD